ncbi:MAG: hypothetical protein H2172_08615 [Opitutus sp.]|nr:hypothetical protein [Opitutus sp.]MCS6246958.1 hypothetical protein [Opitutus sp.]MCS6276416.1 hypothetical protein [Opitutus sp.]MCS6301936.1 hypothetical protein [Opitutus sp.]
MPPSPLLLATLHLHAALPALGMLAAHDETLRHAAGGSREFAVTLSVRGIPESLRIVFLANGTITTSTEAARPGDLRLWFPSAGQFLRTVAHRPALTLPLAGWSQLPQVRRFSAAGARLEALLTTCTETHLALHAWGSLLVGIRASITWLRLHPADHAHLSCGTVIFTCPALPATLWIDLATLTVGTGEPATPVTARITFANIATVLAELDHRLDAPAALGLGTLRIEGHLPLAENLGILMLKVGKLLKKQ